MKFLRIEKSLTSAENVVLTIVNRREGATLLNVDECHSIEVRASDLFQITEGKLLISRSVLWDLEEAAGWESDAIDPEESITFGTIQGL